MPNRIPIHFIRRMLESPDLIAGGTRIAWRKRVTVHRDYRRADGYSQPPVQVGLKLVDACNLRCKMCAQWGETGYNFARPAAELKDILPIDVYRRFIDDVAPIKPWFFIWGGEPFLYPDILPLLTYMKQKGLTTSISTNGTVMERYVKPLVDIGADVLLLSIDGPRDTHDNIRGLKGAFDKTLANVRAIQAEKRRRRAAKPYIAFVAVITANNQARLEEVFELAEDVGVDLMLTFYAWYQTHESGTRHKAIMQERLGITPWSWTGWLWSVEEIDPEIVARTVQKLKSRPWSFSYSFFPELPTDKIAAYYRDHTQTFGYDRCIAPWILGEIMPNGDVVTCRDYPDVVLGNIRNESLLSIWNNQPARAFRQLLQGEGLLPICTRCEGLMGP